MEFMLKYSRYPHLAGLLVSFMVFLCVLGLRASGVLESMELATYDVFLRLRQATSDRDSRIVLI